MDQSTFSVAQLVSAFGCYFIYFYINSHRKVTGSSPVGGGYNKLFVGRVSLYNIMYNWEFGRVVKALVLRSNDNLSRGFDPHNSHLIYIILYIETLSTFCLFSKAHIAQRLARKPSKLHTQYVVSVSLRSGVRIPVWALLKINFIFKYFLSLAYY